jgi:hypothetical protein
LHVCRNIVVCKKYLHMFCQYDRNDTSWLTNRHTMATIVVANNESYLILYIVGDAFICVNRRTHFKQIFFHPCHANTHEYLRSSRSKFTKQDFEGVWINGIFKLRYNLLLVTMIFYRLLNLLTPCRLSIVTPLSKSFVGYSESERNFWAAYKCNLVAPLFPKRASLHLIRVLKEAIELLLTVKCAQAVI